MTTVATAPTPSAEQLRPYTREPLKLAALLGLLAWLDSGPPDPDKYRRVAAWLDKHVPPQEVDERRRMLMPQWSLHPWLDRLWLDANDDACADGRGTASPPAYPWDSWNLWDHRWGAIKVFGVSVLLTEPYYLEPRSPAWNSTGDDSAPSILRDLGRRLGGVAAWSPRSAWGHDAPRILFFPAPDRFPAVLAPRWQRCYYQPDLLPRCEHIAHDMRGTKRPNPDAINPAARRLV